MDDGATPNLYYRGTLWDAYRPVRAELNRRVSGDAGVDWIDHFARRTGRTFERALVLNCGSGRIERDFFDRGLVRHAVGVDFAAHLLDEARNEAGDRPLEYVQMDTNVDPFPTGEFDLVINYDAAHHVTRIDRAFRELAMLLADDGWLVSHDYVGPHRIQFELDSWTRAWAANRELPEALRQEFVYPHLPTMLVDDPSEAVHSELVLDRFARYFTVDELVPVGGAVAYPLLTHNHALLAAPEDASTPLVERLLALDAEYLAARPESTLFAYFTGQPRKDVLADTAQLASWAAEEDEREAAILERNGEYYERTWLQEITIELSAQRIAAQHARAWAEALLADNQLLREELERTRAAADAAQQELASTRSSRSYRAARAVVANPVARKLRGK